MDLGDSTTQKAPVRDRAGHQRLHAVAAGLGLLLLAGLLALSLFPSALGIVANAQHVRIEQIPENNAGAYLLTEQGAIPIYDWRMPMSKLPPDALALETGSLRTLVIAGRQVHPSTAYVLYDLGRQHTVGWQSVQRQGRQLLLQPPRLAPGDYLLIVPTEDVFGSNTYHYFRLYGGVVHARPHD